MDFQIRNGTERDIPLILQMIKGLAEYENLSDQVIATEDGLRESLFGAHPAAEVVIGYAGQQAAGFALFVHNYSTFLGQRGLYLEDLFVFPEWRGKGLGRQLLAYLARIAVERGCGRMEWSVLDWNEQAMRVYRGIGATPLDDWTICRITGDALRRLAGS